MVSAFEGILVPSFFGDFHANFHTRMRSYALFTACGYRAFWGDFYVIRCANIGLLVSLRTWCCRTFRNRISGVFDGDLVFTTWRLPLWWDRLSSLMRCMAETFVASLLLTALACLLLLQTMGTGVRESNIPVNTHTVATYCARRIGLRLSEPYGIEDLCCFLCMLNGDDT